MPLSEHRYSWTWELASSPEALWPLISDTDRFNRDCGFPSVTVVPPAPGEPAPPPDTRRLRTRRYGLRLEWDEYAFEWIAPRSHGVERRFHRGPFAGIRALCELTPRSGGGTTLSYQVWITPAGLFGRLALLVGAPLWQFRAPFGRVFAAYDRRLQAQGVIPAPAAPPLAAGGRRRLAGFRARLADAGQPPALVERLLAFVTDADDFSVARIRPYALADLWQADRRTLLRLFLHAARAGLLDFSWDILCPLCRGAKSVNASLGEISARVHCDACLIDFTVNFEQSVELTFHPNPAVRAVPRLDYCVGGPQITPHIVAQQKLAPGGNRLLPLALAPGRYRLRSLPAGAQHFFRVLPGGGPAGASVRLAAPAPEEPVLSADCDLLVANDTAEARRVILERLAWTEQAATAREVTALQVFRDLFSGEVLRPGEQIAVGSLTLVFTDLRESTRLYQEIGDAPAFGRVLAHFDALKAAAAAEDGAVIKTMGDAVMAVFTRPVAALRAMLAARQTLDPSLALKVGLHHGPCLALNQNGRLDYFGSSVNIAARLSALSDGGDLVCSAATAADPEVAQFLAEHAGQLLAVREQTSLRGFDRQTFDILRLRPARSPNL